MRPTAAQRSPSPQPAHPGLHRRIWLAEAAGTALLVLAIVLAASLALGLASELPAMPPTRV